MVSRCASELKSGTLIMPLGTKREACLKFNTFFVKHRNGETDYWHNHWDSGLQPCSRSISLSLVIHIIYSFLQIQQKLNSQRLPRLLIAKKGQEVQQLQHYEFVFVKKKIFHPIERIQEEISFPCTFCHRFGVCKRAKVIKTEMNPFFVVLGWSSLPLLYPNQNRVFR